MAADPAQIVAFGDDKVNNYIRLKPDNTGVATYRYHASWEKEPGAAKSAAEYAEMLGKAARLKPEVKVAN